jgi:ABC-type branched-subunit amino acid transport system substrate-binding protein
MRQRVLRKLHRSGFGRNSRSPIRHETRFFVVLPVAVTMLITAALSLDSSSYASSPSSQSRSGSHAVLTAASPVKIGAIVSTNNPILSLPSIPASIKAAIRAINARGGFDGHRVVFDYCNDQVNPTTAAQCATQMVNDHVIATVGNFSLFGAAIVPILDSGGIPQLSSEPLVAQQYNSPKSFLVDGGGYGYAESSMIAAKQAGVKKLAIVYVSGAGLDAVIASGVKKATSLGMKVVAQIPVSPAAAQLTTGTIKQLSAGSPTVYGVKLLGAVLPFAAGTPQLKQYAKEMAAEVKSGDSAAGASQWGQNGLQAWAVMHALVPILKTVRTKPLTAASVTKAMNAARNVVTGVMPPWTPSKRGPADIPRVSNPYMYIESVKNGVVVLAQKKPVNSFSG